MLAIDTNIVVRYVVGDGGDEFVRAVRVIESNPVSIAVTVVLETEWVLRDAYDFSRAEVSPPLRGCSDCRPFRLRSRWSCGALDYAEQGLDFADALHLAQATECEAFVTLDRPLARKAKRLTEARVRLA
jgi:predicted nucleic acid-binding protein